MGNGEREDEKLADCDSQALVLCEMVRYWDDRLGKYSDHEGNEEGPTFHLWKDAENFDLQCARAISDHRHAASIWRKLQALNKRRLAALALLNERGRG